MTLSLEQLSCVCEDLRHALEVYQVTYRHLGPTRAKVALAHRAAYLRDIRKLLDSGNPCWSLN